MKTIRILVLGSTGMLGHQVYFYFKNLREYEIIDTSWRKKLTDETILIDVTDLEEIEHLINEMQPAYIINCIGALIKVCKRDPHQGIFLNSVFPHFLADLTRRTKSKLIHISTDCVFSGEKGQYTEEDLPDGTGIYAKSKGLGEIVNGLDLTLRTSIIGPELKRDGEGLLHWFLNQSGVINGYTQVFWSGVTTLELTKVILQSINQDLTGLYHVTNSQRISKYGLLKIIQNVFEKADVTILESDENRNDKSLVDTRKELKMEIGSYEKMIMELKEFMSKNRDLYLHYMY